VRLVLKKIKKLLKEVSNVQIDHSIIRNKNGHLWVEFLDGRQQRVFIDQKSKYYKIWSIVLHRSKVEGYGEVNLIQYVWNKNRQTDVVDFYIDKKGRMVGSILQLAETIDYDELVFYIHILAKESDRLEFLLSGKDSN